MRMATFSLALRVLPFRSVRRPLNKEGLQTRVAALLATNACWEAGQLISDAIVDHVESSSLWNDWAVVPFTAGQLRDAERALLRAIHLDPPCIPAAEHLGTMLHCQGKRAEALPHLLRAHHDAKDPQRELLAQLIASCDSGISAAQSPERCALLAPPRQLPCRPNAPNACVRPQRHQQLRIACLAPRHSLPCLDRLAKCRQI
jgi:hypothetical protein